MGGCRCNRNQQPQEATTANIAVGLTPLDAPADIAEGIYELKNGDYGGALLSLSAVFGLDFIKDGSKVLDFANDVKSVANKSSDLPLVKKGAKEWDSAVSEITKIGKGKTNIRVESSSEAKTLLKESKGNMNRYKQYSKDKGTKYKKGYETHNQKNKRELDAGNDLQHIKWKDGKSGGHIYYDKP
jgi:hypothetical protein